MDRLQGLIDLCWIDLLSVVQAIDQPIDFVVLPPELGIVLVCVSPVS